MADQDIQLRSPGANAWDVTLSEEEAVVFPQKTVGWVKVRGRWCRGILWKKVGNDWKISEPYVKVQGDWK